jgi:hypothetical protein
MLMASADAYEQRCLLDPLTQPIGRTVSFARAFASSSSLLTQYIALSWCLMLIPGSCSIESLCASHVRMQCVHGFGRTRSCNPDQANAWPSGKRYIAARSSTRAMPGQETSRLHIHVSQVLMSGHFRFVSPSVAMFLGACVGLCDPALARLDLHHFLPRLCSNLVL